MLGAVMQQRGAVFWRYTELSILVRECRRHDVKRYQYYRLITAIPNHGIQGWGESKLDELLAQGWKPVRETPMGGGPVAGNEVDGFGFAFGSLILLEKDDPA